MHPGVTTVNTALADPVAESEVFEQPAALRHRHERPVTELHAASGYDKMVTSR